MTRNKMLRRLLTVMLVFSLTIVLLIPASAEGGSLSAIGIIGRKTRNVISTSGETYEVSVTFGPEAHVPENAVLEAYELNENDTSYAAYLEKLEAFLPDEKTVSKFRLFDIEIMVPAEGDQFRKIQPQTPVEVKISYTCPLTVHEDEDLQIIHFSGEGAETLVLKDAPPDQEAPLPQQETGSTPKTSSEDEFTYVQEHSSFVFDTESFSVFAVAASEKSQAYANAQGRIIYMTFDDPADLLNNQSGTSQAQAQGSLAVYNEDGYFKGALQLNSPDDRTNAPSYLQFPDGTLAGYDALTVSFYAKPYVDTSNRWAFFTGSSTSTYLGIFQRIEWNGSKDIIKTVAERKLNNTNIQTGSAANRDRVNAAMNDWSHIAVVYETGKTSLYVNGVLVEQKNTTFRLSDIIQSGSPFYIGHSLWGNHENFRGLLDEYSVYGRALSAEEVAALAVIKQNYVLNPLNLHSSGGYSDHSAMVISRTDDPGAKTRRIPVFPEYGPDGTAWITLPDDTELANGSGNTAGFRLIKDANKYEKRLRGWYNIATGDYYDVSSGPVQARIRQLDNNVFYADWESVYPTVMPAGLANTPDTTDYVTTRIYDYNELFNLRSSYLTQNGTDAETWRDSGNGILFMDGSIVPGSSPVSSVWTNSSLGRPYQSAEQNTFYRNGVEGIYDNFGSKVEELFPDSSSLGIDYLGEGNHLYVYDPETGYYQFDSHNMGSVYNRAEQRFYTTLRTQKHVADGAENADGFLPLNDWSENGTKYKFHDGSTNYWFGISSEINFWLTDDVECGGNKIHNEDMIFSFRGDDDVWVFLDDELVLDLGGIHTEISGSINFSTGEVSQLGTLNSRFTEILRQTKKGEHRLKIYYMERGANASDCLITFNIAPRWEQEPRKVNTVTAEKLWEGEGINHYNSILRGVTLRLFKVYGGQRVDRDFDRNNPAASEEIRPVDIVRLPDEEDNWTALWERLDPDYDYEVDELIPDDPYPWYTAKIERTMGQSHNYWAHAMISESRIHNAQILIGSSDNSGDVNRDFLLGVVNGVVTNVPTDVVYGTADRADVTDAVKWEVVVASTGSATSLEKYHLRHGAQYLALTDNGPVLTNEANAGEFYLNSNGDLHDEKSAPSLSNNIRLAVGPDGIYTTRSDGSIQTSTGESEDRIYIFAEENVSTKKFQFTIRNTPQFEILQLRKISTQRTSSGEEAPLAGGEFILYHGEPDENGNFSADQVIAQLRSDEDGYLQGDPSNAGIIDVEGKRLMLEYGIYYLKETKPPNGYHALEEVLKIEVTPEKAEITQNGEIQQATFEPVHFTEYAGGRKHQMFARTLRITNTPGVELPSTGGSGTLPYTLCGLLLISIALMYGFRMRRRERRLNRI